MTDFAPMTVIPLQSRTGRRISRQTGAATLAVAVIMLLVVSVLVLHSYSASWLEQRATQLPVEDLVTSLAALTNVGLTGSDAGTALKNALMRLMSPTKKAAELIRARLERFVGAVVL
jgi:predicted transcriptional regulator